MNAASSVRNISLYIPYVSPEITREDIIEEFMKQKIGSITRIDFVPKMDKKGDYYHCAFLHFEYWFENQVTIHIQKRLQNLELETRIVYDDPWFWVIKENKSVVFTQHVEEEEKCLGYGIQPLYFGGASGSGSSGGRKRRLCIAV